MKVKVFESNTVQAENMGNQFRRAVATCQTPFHIQDNGTKVHQSPPCKKSWYGRQEMPGVGFQEGLSQPQIYEKGMTFIADVFKVLLTVLFT